MRWYIPKSAVRDVARRLAPGSHPAPEEIEALEALALRLKVRLPRVPRDSTSRPGKISHGYKKALIKAIERVVCAPKLPRW